MVMLWHSKLRLYSASTLYKPAQQSRNFLVFCLPEDGNRALLYFLYEKLG